MSGYGTNFVESEAVLAAGQRDVSRVDELLADMLPNELADFESACELLVTARFACDLSRAAQRFTSRPYGCEMASSGRLI